LWSLWATVLERIEVCEACGGGCRGSLPGVFRTWGLSAAALGCPARAGAAGAWGAGPEF